jgi:hypothetical protein
MLFRSRLVNCRYGIAIWPSAGEDGIAEEPVKVESVRLSTAPADPATLHKKMMQLMSSLWVTQAVAASRGSGLPTAHPAVEIMEAVAAEAQLK